MHLTVNLLSIILFTIFSNALFSQSNEEFNINDLPDDFFEVNDNDYKKSILIWKKYKKLMPQFPDSLNPNQEYKMIVHPPGFNQIEPFMYLKIEFKNKKLASNYFKSFINFEKEFKNLYRKTYSRGMYCGYFVDGEHFFEGSSKKIDVKLIKFAWCDSNNKDRDIGGFQSGISIDKKKKSVFCWVAI